jgi:ribA/ribD-fused uncharacterized protein
MSDNWFSNFLPFDVPLIHRDISYPTVEHYYQAMKTLDMEYRQKIAACSTPGQAKRMGQKAPELRRKWATRRLHYMEKALRYKFAKGTTWHKKLMKSNRYLTEWNYWHDNFWGSCTCPGCWNISDQSSNHLGKILMKIKKEK